MNRSRKLKRQANTGEGIEFVTCRLAGVVPTP